MFDPMFGLTLVVLVFSVVFHEYAHGYIAMKSGDYTAKFAGRLTFNPIVHIDLFGTIILPVLLIVTSSPFLFAWAKPVPVNPYNFRNPGIDNVKVSIAGPVSNLILASGFTVLWIFLGLFVPSLYYELVPVLRYGLLINVLLAVFNMMPIPPLDGSHILAYFLPPELSAKYQQIQQYGFMILIIFIMTPLFNIVYYFVNIVNSVFISIIRLFL